MSNQEGEEGEGNGWLKKMKSSRAAGMDGIVVEMLKIGGLSINDQFLRIFNKCMKWCSGVYSPYI